MPHHTIVRAEPHRFFGWPANNGAWIWDGREILAGYAAGGYAVQPGHNIVPPITLAFARSLDGGETWRPESPAGWSDSGVPRDPPGDIDFTAPGFALRVMGAGYHGCDDPRGRFYYSLDRGRRWHGPYTLGDLPAAPALRGWELTPRTDYVVLGPQECLLLLSARPRDRFGSDRVFCALTTDGGATFRFLAWVVSPADPYRAVMPATVPLAGEPSGGPAPAAIPLVSAIRRREPDTERCWIDAYRSLDGGASWSFLSFVAGTGRANGNPPALLRLADGRLCCAYGHRTRRQLLARLSDDQGTTWSPELVLREGYHSPEDDEDFGYPRLVQRADGCLVALYYWAGAGHPAQHIAATIWQPEE